MVGAAGLGDAGALEGGRGDCSSARHHGLSIKASHAAGIGAQQRLHLLPHLLFVYLLGGAGEWNTPAVACGLCNWVIRQQRHR